MNHNNFLKMVNENDITLNCTIDKVLKNEAKYVEEDESTHIFHEASCAHKEKLCYQILAENGIEDIYYDRIEERIDRLIDSLIEIQSLKNEVSDSLPKDDADDAMPLLDMYLKLKEFVIKDAAKNISMIVASIKDDKKADKTASGERM